jgi:hypothetical protein
MHVQDAPVHGRGAQCREHVVLVQGRFVPIQSPMVGLFRIREYLFPILRLIINRSCLLIEKIRERERKQDVGNSIRFFRQHKCYTFREKLIRGFVYWYNFRVGQKIIVFILGSLNH